MQGSFQRIIEPQLASQVKPPPGFGELKDKDRYKSMSDESDEERSSSLSEQIAQAKQKPLEDYKFEELENKTWISVMDEEGFPCFACGKTVGSSIRKLEEWAKKRREIQESTPV